MSKKTVKQLKDSTHDSSTKRKPRTKKNATSQELPVKPFEVKIQVGKFVIDLV